MIIYKTTDFHQLQEVELLLQYFLYSQRWTTVKPVWNNPRWKAIIMIIVITIINFYTLSHHPTPNFARSLPTEKSGGNSPFATNFWLLVWLSYILAVLRPMKVGAYLFRTLFQQNKVIILVTIIIIIMSGCSAIAKSFIS